MSTPYITTGQLFVSQAYNGIYSLDISCSHLCYYLTVKTIINMLRYKKLSYWHYDTIRYDTIRYDTIRYDTIRYDTIRYDTIRYDTIRYDTIRYDTIRYDTIRYDRKCCSVVWAQRRDISDTIMITYNFHLSSHLSNLLVCGPVLEPHISHTWRYYLALSVRGPTVDVRIWRLDRRQILTSKVSLRTKRANYL